MTDSASGRSQPHPRTDLTPLLTDLDPSFSPQQLKTVETLLKQALTRAKPQPKLVDLRFVIDLFFARYYFVLFIGRDQRTKKRQRPTHPLSRVGNILAAILILLCLNLLLSAILLLMLYLLKSAAGIDLLPGHFGMSD